MREKKGNLKKIYEYACLDSQLKYLPIKMLQ